MRHGQTRQQGHSRRVTQERRADGGGEGLAGQDYRHAGEGEPGVLENDVELDQHPDRHEEQRNEDVAEGQELRHRLVGVVGLRDDEAGEERPQCERSPDRLGAERGERAHENDRDEEQLAASGLQDLGEDARHDRTGRDEHSDHDECRLAEGDDEPGGAPGGASREERQREHHGHDAQVLEDQDARGEPAVGGVDVTFLGEQLQDDCGAGQRGQEAKEQGHLPSRRPGRGDGCRGRHGEPHLARAGDGDLAPHLSEPAERELDPDREEEQDHAYFGEALDPMHVGDEAERVGPEQHARDDESRERRQTQAVKDEDDDERGAEDHRQVAQYQQLLHDP